MSMTLKASTARERFYLLHLHPALGMYERLSMVYLTRLAVGSQSPKSQNNRSPVSKLANAHSGREMAENEKLTDLPELNNHGMPAKSVKCSGEAAEEKQPFFAYVVLAPPSIVQCATQTLT